MKKIIFILVLTTTKISAEQTAANFLKIIPSAKEAALGTGAISYYEETANSPNPNPAVIAFTDKKEVSLTHNEWLGDTKYEFLSYAQSTKYGVFGLNFKYLHMDSIEKRGESEELLGNYKSYDMAVGLSYSKKLSNHSSYGLRLKYIKENIDDFSAGTVAGDMGFFFPVKTRNTSKPYPLDRVGVGLLFENIGGKVKFNNKSYNLPANIKLAFRNGWYYKDLWDTKGDVIRSPFNFGGGIEYYLYEKVFYLSAGVEYKINSIFTLRAGFKSDNKKKDYRNQFITLGMGFKAFGTYIDYAFESKISESGSKDGNDLNSSHRITLSYSF